jgi:hypothetical protein
MKPIGKTYLIKCDFDSGIRKQDGIYVIDNVNVNDDVFWKGYITAYGNGFTDEETKDLLPIGTKVVMEYGKKAKMKIVIGKSVFYVRDVDEVIGVVEDD